MERERLRFRPSGIVYRDITRKTEQDMLPTVSPLLLKTTASLGERRNQVFLYVKSYGAAEYSK